MVSYSWGVQKNGEPGLLFHDEINRFNPTPRLGTIDCAEAILMAWKLKLKGITMYREGSRRNAVLNLKGTPADSGV
jgi:ribonucleoside-diphosphate reductase alpha chain